MLRTFSGNLDKQLQYATCEVVVLSMSNTKIKQKYEKKTRLPFLIVIQATKKNTTNYETIHFFASNYIR
jgi:hypothetical protein